MKALSTISFKKKDEPLLPQTIETPELTDPGIPEKKTQKKKFLKSVLDGATYVMFTLLCLAPGRIVMAWCGSTF